MRIPLVVMILIFSICCSVPSDLPSVANQEVMLSAPENPDYKAALAQKAELRRLHRELRSRAILRRLGDRINRINLDFLDTKFGVKTLPEFEGLSDLDIQDRIIDIEEKVTWEGMTYGTNNLQDVFETVPEIMEPGVRHVRDTDIIKASHSVVAIIRKASLKLQLDGTYHLTTQPLKIINDSFTLCNFSDFYNAAYTDVAGTGFLVADTLIATAGHVYDNTPDLLTEHYFVFDYKMLTPGQVKTTYTSLEVYEAKDLFKRMNIDGNDWALILLQRIVEGRDPLSYRSQGKIDKEAKLYLLGHPFGLPMKYSGIGKVLNNIPCHFFTSNIDNYEYNSGSPVLDRSSHLVEGILCRDLGPDEEEYCSCYAPSIFRTQFGVPGVEITRSFMFASYLERYDFVTVRCTIEAACVDVDGEVIDLEMGEEKDVPFSEFGIQLLASPECWAPYATDRGDVWEIMDGPDGQVIMKKVCK